MRYILPILVVLLMVSCKEESEEITFTEVDYNGLEKVLNKQDNKTYVVNFWATWCAPCVKELPYFERINKQYKDKNVEVVLVSLDFPKHFDTKLKNFINEKQLQSELYALNDMDSNYWIPKVNKDWSGAIPATLIYNSNKREFFEQAFEYEELERTLNKFLK
ncbi:thiol-disulfide isomerase/thioredoxin [Mesoflavibacter sabulilitoris]|uniref:Thioredoxin n=1 Tax=Mesoflavibacter zeaxanthinifaciens subsp. sabulilitoris TaxID=1520893 RepID=A0A2T1NBQ5_9FLAO|nr:TlpA disulfide reductase family protein [Mesoflavibacter zeaxanthinifaciens]MBB3125051.1 thiol-disulfide isomerase/thioredoxin [Mesoflavibacter zeaxanthinifaciens subsp. sabulilitoris]PSG89830.1 thioredoxin [Mesoflavibacter zeaxanthinifaciens subsp. sabulilitoris]